VEFYEGKPISVELPATVDMTVVETEPGLKGASGLQRHQARQARNRPGGAGAAVHYGGREDSRQHRRRHLPGTGLKARRRQLSFFFRQHRSQIQQSADRLRRARSPADRRAQLRASAPSSAHAMAISQVGMRLLGRGAAADHGFPGVTSA
jgi:hypothetical protein